MGFEKPEQEGSLWCTWQLQLAGDFLYLYQILELEVRLEVRAEFENEMSPH